MRELLFYIFLYIKGLCVGATGVLHGVSGGSMAVLLGVHQRFVLALNAFDRQAFRLLRNKDFQAFWKKIDGGFLLTLISGIITGVLILRTVFAYYYAAYPIFISSFFFSLVCIAALLLLRKITRWTPGILLTVVSGLALSYGVTLLSPLDTPQIPALSFLSGLVVGGTFVLPGVSEAFILMFFEKYQYILASFGSLDFAVMILFIAGTILGLVIFAQFIAYLLFHYFNATVALFAGLMIGSLNKIWPWREVIEYATTIEGKRIPAFDKSILPWRYLESTGKDPQVFYAILMMALGVLMVVMIEKITARLKTRS